MMRKMGSSVMVPKQNPDILFLHRSLGVAGLIIRLLPIDLPHFLHLKAKQGPEIIDHAP
jgi:hypothetical protein